MLLSEHTQPSLTVLERSPTHNDVFAFCRPFKLTICHQTSRRRRQTGTRIWCFRFWILPDPPARFPLDKSNRGSGNKIGAALVLARMNTQEGEFINREINTRIKEKPTNNDLGNINNAIVELMKQHYIAPT